jgi:membrane protein required for colicin V production
MNFLDLIIILILTLFAIQGFRSGFIKQFFGIAGIIVAVFLTFKYMGAVSPYLSSFIENPDYATITAGIIIFIISLTIIQLIAFWLEEVLKMVRINFINRLAGMIFGAANMLIIISAFLLLLAGFNFPGETVRENSASYSTVVKVAPAAFNLIAHVYPETTDFIDEIEKSIQENNTLRELPIFERLSL